MEMIPRTNHGIKRFIRVGGSNIYPWFESRSNHIECVFTIENVVKIICFVVGWIVHISLPNNIKSVYIILSSKNI